MKAALASGILLIFATSTSLAQVNGSAAAAEGQPPFNLEEIGTFNYPWRIAFLPDGRMLVTEKSGALQLVTAAGGKTRVNGVPAVLHRGQGGLLGVYISPTYEQDQDIYLTYSEPADRGSGLALARARLALDGASPSLQDLRVIWRDPAGGSGGQFGGALAFSPDGQHLFLAVGERQRMTPAQDPDSPLGKILRLTLDGEPASGNPQEGAVGASTLPIIRPPRNTEAAKTARPVFDYTYSGPNWTPAEIWTSGHRNPYGLAFDPGGRLWELEHGPRGGDELNLIQPGKNYGWPLVSEAPNYDGTPIPTPSSRPDFTPPLVYWTPVIAPGNMAFYAGPVFPEWEGALLVSGLGSRSLALLRFDAAGQPLPAARWQLGRRLRDVAVAPDGTVWLAEDSPDGGLYRLVPEAGD